MKHGVVFSDRPCSWDRTICSSATSTSHIRVTADVQYRIV